MSVIPLSEIKESYLELILLIAHHRREQLGRMGRTVIPCEEIRAIEDESGRIHMFNTLVDDDILRVPAEATEDRPYVLNEQDDECEYVFFTTKTAAEIRRYHDELEQTLQRGYRPIDASNIRVDSWESVTMRFLSEESVHVRTPTGDAVLDCKSMSMLNRRSNRPIKAWKILQLLALGEGVMSYRHGSNVAETSVRKQKEILAKKLKAVFHCSQDPFLSVHETPGEYVTRFAIEKSYQDEQRDDSSVEVS